MAQDTKQDTGLIQRGLFLLMLIGGIVAVVLWIIFQRPTQTLPGATKQAEPYVATLALPELASPGAVSWTSLGMLVDLLPSSPGWEVRYNAAGSLARTGSAHVPWDEVAEMLDEGQQMRNFRVRLDSGVVVPDEAAARLTVLAALKAVKQWHQHEKQRGEIKVTPQLNKVYAAVDRLRESAVVELKRQAEETRAASRKAG